MKGQDLVSLLKDTYNEWSEDKAPRLAAALAYYTVFSLAPLLVITIAIIGLVYGQEAARGQIVGQIQGLVGQQGAEAIQSMIAGASKPSTGILATIIGLVTLLFGASGVFGELQSTLNTIWEVQLRPGQGIMATIRQRFFSFTMVLGTGFLLLVSLALSAALVAFTKFLGNQFSVLAPVLNIVNFLISFGITTLLFALIFKVVPDVEIDWEDVWIGAAVTALLFSIGRLLLSLYLGNSSFSSTYGAAGSLIVILLWIYYSAQILFFGAEFTQVYAKRFGKRIEPAPNAIPLTEEARAEQGLTREVGGSDPGTTRGNGAQPVPTTAEPSPGAAKTGLAGFLAGMIVGMRRRSR